MRMPSKMFVLALLFPSFAHAGIMLEVIGGANPNGAPDNGGTQWLLGLTLTGSDNGVVLGGDMAITGALHDTVSPAGQDIVSYTDVMFQLDGAIAELSDPGPDPYVAVNDSYWASPWSNVHALFPPMGAEVIVYVRVGAGIPGPATIPLAYVNVPNGGEVHIAGDIARSPSDTTGLIAVEVAELIEQLSGSLNHTLTSTGVLTNASASPIPEPSPFVILSLLGLFIGTGTWCWRRRETRDRRTSISSSRGS